MAIDGGGYVYESSLHTNSSLTAWMLPRKVKVINKMVFS